MRLVATAGQHDRRRTPKWTATHQQSFDLDQRIELYQSSASFFQASFSLVGGHEAWIHLLMLLSLSHVAHPVDQVNGFRDDLHLLQASWFGDNYVFTGV